MVDKPLLERSFNEDADVDSLLSEGCLHARMFLEVQGNDKEACKNALERTVFDSLVAEENVTVLNVKFYELQKDAKDEFFSGVVEIDLLFRDFRWFVNVTMRYGPSAIEIIEPHHVKINLDEMQSILADVSELSQTFSSQILTLLRDDERKKVYSKIVKGSKLA
jgi:hypothetical protein